MNNSKSHFDSDESKSDEIAGQASEVDNNIDSISSSDEESTIADVSSVDASSDTVSVSAIDDDDATYPSSTSIKNDVDSALVETSDAHESDDAKSSDTESDDAKSSDTESGDVDSSNTESDGTTSETQDADKNLAEVQPLDESQSTSKKDTGALPLQFDTDTAVKASTGDHADEHTPTPTLHSEKRRTVLTFGVSEEEDSTKQHDTAILSENNSGLRRAISSQSSSTMPDGTATLGDNREVILVIRGMIERLLLHPDIRYKLGRFELGTKGLNEIDLTPYGALDRGVSRLHAELLLQEGRLYIVDLDSSNGTYIAGRRLNPHQIIPLRKGDELMLGRLPMQVLFR